MEDLHAVPRVELIERLKQYGFRDHSADRFDDLVEPLLRDDLPPDDAKRICDALDEERRFKAEAGPLANCVEWVELRRKVGAPSEKWG